jgi:hypothetical protein
LLIFILTVNSYGQETNPRSENKFGIGAQLGGPTLILSINLNYFINHNYNVEIGAGLFGLYGGLNYYFGQSDKSQRWAPYIGAHYTMVSLPTISQSETLSGIYAPIGIQFMAKNGFTFAPEIAFIHINKEGDLNIKDYNDNSIKTSSTGINILDVNGNTVDLLSSGIEFNGNTKKFVTHAELDTALQTFVGLLNTNLGVKLDGGGTPGALVLNIAAAATTTLKTGG